MSWSHLGVDSEAFPECDPSLLYAPVLTQQDVVTAHAREGSKIKSEALPALLPGLHS